MANYEEFSDEVDTDNYQDHVSDVPSMDAPAVPTQRFLIRKRIAVLGGRAVGKSAIVRRCALNSFQKEYWPTFDDTYEYRPVVDGIHYDINIVDTEGLQPLSPFGLHYTIGIDGYILVFSVTNCNSFQLIQDVNEKLLKTLDVINMEGTDEVPRILVGNQADNVEQRQVSYEQAAKYASKQKIPYIEASAYTSFNTHEVFHDLLRIIDHNLRRSYSILSSDQPPPKSSGPPVAPNEGATEPDMNLQARGCVLH